MNSTHKQTKKYQARKLRKQGKSYEEIKKIIQVSKSTLSLWLRDITLTKEQQNRLIGRQKSRFIASKKRQNERIKLTKTIIASSIDDSKKLIEDKLFLSGLMLYWAEGTKRGQEMVAFSNSDPNMIILMMKWFRKICQVDEEKIRIQIHAHNRLKEKKLLDHWSKITKIPQAQFHKLIIKKTSLSHRKNILYNGTCSIRICNRNLFRKIMGWKIGTLKSFGLDDDYKIPK